MRSKDHRLSKCAQGVMNDLQGKDVVPFVGSSWRMLIQRLESKPTLVLKLTKCSLAKKLHSTSDGDPASPPVTACRQHTPVIDAFCGHPP